MAILFLTYFLILITVQVQCRELMIRRACQTDPTFSFCRHHTKTAEIRSEAQKKRDVFLQWSYVAAKDDQDIEDVDELEPPRKKPYSIPDYCTRYAENFKSYCTNGQLTKLEGLLTHFCGNYMTNCNVAGKVQQITESDRPEKIFPKTKPFFSTTTSKPNKCDGISEKYKMECEKEGFLPKFFCRKYLEMCGKLEKVDADTTKSVVDDDTDSLETPDEFEEHQRSLSEKVSPKEDEDSVSEAQDVGIDEVKAYCTNYIENYNFYCVGDMDPDHGEFCNSYRRNCPDRVS
ncbi:hypothetical protein B9Z55_028690 [Caenorhabditis nigoni]|uniref:DUF19 domain-containing protein n=1 Tax=Caenorhabditis nigoni TaxID=1611254 RepID=A0A2G5SAR9_9PELO|nr:hypothetical protein B9Z55_028690 [Caenorhabditis nigoni]